MFTGAIMIRRVIFLLLVIALLGVVPLAAQTDSVPLLMRSVGILDPDGSVFYSVYLATGDTALSTVTASVTVPAGLTFEASVLAPETVTVTTDGATIAWALAELPADTLIGPLTFHVTIDAADTAIPAGLAVQATWADGAADLPQSEDVLTAFTTTGSLVIDAAGTVDEASDPAVVSVGDTGLLVYIPAGAISAETTINFERLPVPTGAEAAEFFPPEAEGTWWCSVVRMTLEPDVEVSQPILLAIPTRRAVTPGLASGGFFRLPDGDWQVMTGSTMFVSPDGLHTIANGIQLTNGLEVAYGVSDSTRLSATINGTTLGTNVTDGTSNTVRDGTSNTIVQQFTTQPTSGIIAILIGIR